MANEHIEQYLRWYLSESCNSPFFAVLINGSWGSGKTYFIKEFMQEYNGHALRIGGKTEDNFIYISLYGLSSTSEIDDLIFQRIHPILSSKSAAITGKVLKGLLKR